MPGSLSQVKGVRLSSSSLYVGNIPNTVSDPPNTAIDYGFVGCIDKVLSLYDWITTDVCLLMLVSLLAKFQDSRILYCGRSNYIWERWKMLRITVFN